MFHVFFPQEAKETLMTLINPTAFSPMGGPLCPHKKKKKETLMATTLSELQLETAPL